MRSLTHLDLIIKCNHHKVQVTDEHNNLNLMSSSFLSCFPLKPFFHPTHHSNHLYQRHYPAAFSTISTILSPTWSLVHNATHFTYPLLNRLPLYSQPTTIVNHSIGKRSIYRHYHALNSTSFRRIRSSYSRSHLVELLIRFSKWVFVSLVYHSRTARLIM